ncbi:hypothetical protein [Breoghania sp.]|uniref:hypothetical protein n=1 Tax=Breoghania sp. TaxID=2065378 RepID=UPI00261A816A|nr:hypothetical protein [Breoghania sp.]MDJ0933119.1 hypothetical protein [Breoghania sp.]
MKLSVSVIALLAAMAGAQAALAQDLTIGLQNAPDLLDPDRSRTFVGKVVFQSMCDTLVDINADLKTCLNSPRAGTSATTRRISPSTCAKA